MVFTYIQNIQQFQTSPSIKYIFLMLCLMQVSIGNEINRNQLNHQAFLCVKKPHQIF